MKEKLKELKPDLAYSNYTKTDKNYSSSVVPEIFDVFDFSANNHLMELLNTIIHKEDDFEKADSKNLLQQIYIDSTFEKTKATKLTVNDEILKDRLIEYKNKMHELTGRTPFSVTEVKNLARRKPAERYDLYGCFVKRSKTKVRLYGNDILKIISDYLEEEKKGLQKAVENFEKRYKKSRESK